MEKIMECHAFSERQKNMHGWYGFRKVLESFEIVEHFFQTLKSFGKLIIYL